MPIIQEPKRSVVMEPEDKEKGMTLAELQELVVAARAQGAPDGARFGADLFLSFDSPGKVRRAAVVW